MDPNVLLIQLRELVAQVQRQEGCPPMSAAYHKRDAEDLAAKVEALDAWLTQGGFKPADWDAKVRTPHVLHDGN